MTTLLISDLHLHPTAPALTEGFLDWLERNTQDPVSLYLLGDIFDAWIGDDLMALEHHDPSGHAALAVRVARALKAASLRGANIFLMHGNRDFLLGEDFAAAAGASLLADPSVIDVHGRRILLMHGDSLCTRDDAYMAFRAQARDPQWQASILAMPFPERLALAQRLREQSGEANSTKAVDIMDVTPDEVVKSMHDHGVTTLIHGHTHRPDVHDLEVDGQAAKRYVLGDWNQAQGWQLKLDDDGLELTAFSL